MAGLFITFDGLEGSGKSTQIQRLKEWLEQAGHEVVATREPGGTDNAETLRNLLVSGDTAAWSPVSECLIMNAARSDHLERLIRPALAEGKIVLCDRFMDSTRAYQGGGGKLPMADILAIERSVVGETVPDVTFLFDLDPAIGLGRAGKRNAGHDNSGHGEGGQASEDRFERKGPEYHAAVRDVFRQIATDEPDRCILIDAALPIDSVTLALHKALQSRGIPG
ncbi:thymidylate kinase [Aquisalinus flavus]|uniref:Thymidylate kinase n=2 Tax=Aquisalinus flavus TaxID=1526572 RepID=A0A8J2Y4V5_9PROT|nr:dTMP kinase [Aquisalinus flavus]GGD03436.1 thymidylate kinase [Aquisalinus flavus]